MNAIWDVRNTIFAAVLFPVSCSLCAASVPLKTLPGHRPALPAGLSPQGRLPATNQLRLAFGLPVRDPRGLDDFLAQVYDPASRNFRR
jgi:hypothetical protein